MFSKSTEIALRAVIFIAQNSSKEKKISISKISSGINSPLPFTAKILQKLTTDNKIVSSSTGPNGGFFLTEKAKGLPIHVVLEAMESEKILDKCLLGLNQCSEENPCPMHNEYKQIKQKLKVLFKSKTIRDLINDMNNPSPK